MRGELDSHGGLVKYEAADDVVLPRGRGAAAPHEVGQLGPGGLVAWSEAARPLSCGVRAQPSRTSAMQDGSLGPAGGLSGWAASDTTWLQLMQGSAARQWSGGPPSSAATRGSAGAAASSQPVLTLPQAPTQQVRSRTPRKRQLPQPGGEAADGALLRVGQATGASGSSGGIAPSGRSFSALAHAAAGEAHPVVAAVAPSDGGGAPSATAAQALARRFRAVLPAGPEAARMLLRTHWSRVDGDSDGALTPEELFVGLTRLAPLGFDVAASDVGALAHCLAGGDSIAAGGGGVAAAGEEGGDEGLRTGRRWPSVPLSAAIEYVLAQPGGLAPLEGSAPPPPPFGVIASAPVDPRPPLVLPVAPSVDNIIAHVDAPVVPSEKALAWLRRQVSRPSTAVAQWGRAVGAAAPLPLPPCDLEQRESLSVHAALRDDGSAADGGALFHPPMRRHVGPEVPAPGQPNAALPALGSGIGQRASPSIAALLSSFAAEPSPAIPCSPAFADAFAASAAGGGSGGTSGSRSYLALHEMRTALATPAGRAALASPRRPPPAPPNASEAAEAARRVRLEAFRAQWEARHGAAAAKELRADAAAPAEGPTWTRAAPQPFRVLHMAAPPRPAPRAAA